MVIEYEYFDCGVTRCINRKEKKDYYDELEKVKTQKDELERRMREWTEVLLEKKGTGDEKVQLIIAESMQKENEILIQKQKIQKLYDEIDSANKITAELENKNKELKQEISAIKSSYELDNEIKALKVELQNLKDEELRRKKILEKLDSYIDKGKKIYADLRYDVERAEEKLNLIMEKIKDSQKEVKTKVSRRRKSSFLGFMR